ncbi:MAG: hypothetical protein ACREPR_11570 [Brasilonema sp.]
MSAKFPTLARGADGWRAVINEGFSISTAASLAQVIGTELCHRFGRGHILVAHDGRFCSTQAAEEVATKIAETGHNVIFAGLLSTPLATFAVRKLSYLGALVVTAGHNPFYWNGIKLKVAPGLPPSWELEFAIENRRQHIASASKSDSGRIEQLDLVTLKNAYLDEITQGIDLESIRSINPTLCVDGLGGVAGSFFCEAMQYFGCNVKSIGVTIDPLFNGKIPDPMCQESRLQVIKLCQEINASVGFLLDGDGDRLGVIGNQGNFILPHNILALLLLYLHDKGKTLGIVTTTVSTGDIVRRVAHRLGCQHRETPIGFKHIAHFLQEGSTLIAGGSVGDIGIRGYGYDRDPIAATLFLLELMAKSQKSINDLVVDLYTEFGFSHYYEKTYLIASLSPNELRQVTFQALTEAKLKPSRNINNCDGFKFYMDRNAWLLVRKISTEKGIRVYMEADQEEDIDLLKSCLDKVLKI